MKIALITCSRADWNGLGYLGMELIAAGHTVKVLVYDHSHVLEDIVRQDGFMPEVISRLGFDVIGRPRAAWLAGTVTSGISDLLKNSGVNLAFIAGDRYEHLAAAVAANVSGVPIAHIAGGDLTHGSDDDAYRHAITKLSHLHFATNFGAGKRIVLMGEAPNRVYVVGSPAVDRLLDTTLMFRPGLLRHLNVEDRPLVLFNWQPETAAAEPNQGLQSIIDALDIVEDLSIVVVGANPDPGQSEAEAMISSWENKHPTAGIAVFSNIVPSAYASLMSLALFMIGNSSSGYYEAPYFGTPVIDVGFRQAGRVRSANIVSLAADNPNAIRACVGNVRKKIEGRTVSQPYGRGDACKQIVNILTQTDVLALRPKRFYEPHSM